jgi:peptidoglycan/LPS O-acetylase OafA/YrhL
MQTGKDKHIPALTGIRAMAAYLVFLHHFYSLPLDGKPEYGGNIFNFLHIGVSLFFVLSGFLIHHHYYAEFSEGGGSKRRFLLHRFARIMPLYLILTCFTFLVLPFVEVRNNSEWLSLFMLNISLLKGFLPDALFSGIPQAWSLTVEFCFYLIAPFCFSMFRNKAAYYLRFGIFLLLTGFMISWFGSGLVGKTPFFLTYTFAGRSLEFFAGCIISARYSSGFRSSTSFPVFTFTGIAGVSLLLLAMILSPVSSYGWLVNLVFTLLLPFLIAVFFRGLLSENSFVKAFFSLKIMQTLGRSSFAFYLIHVGVVERGLSLFISNNVLILFLLLNLLAWILYQFVETPARRWVLRRFAM